MPFSNELPLIAQRTLEHLEHHDCGTACYRYPKSHANQSFHDHLCWPLAVPFLEALATQTSERQSLEPGDTDHLRAGQPRRFPIQFARRLMPIIGSRPQIGYDRHQCHPVLPSIKVEYPSRLIHETSPYLLRRADNPFDWYPWGEEARRQAYAQG